MRVAMAVEGTRGDVHPMLALADALHARGHEVVVCAPPDFRGEAEARGHAFHAVGLAVRAYLSERAHALVGGPWAMAREAQRYLEDAVPKQFAALPEAVAGADCLLAAGVQAAASSVAERLGVPYRFVAYCPVLFPSADHAPPTLPTRSFPRPLNRWLWRAVVALHNRSLGPHVNAGRDAIGLPPVRNLYRHLIGDRPLLAADAPLAELPSDCPFEVDRIPCLHPRGGEVGDPFPEKLESFLAAGPPPVYLGFGSMTDPDPRRTTRELLRSLTGLGCRALISRGWAGLGGEPLPEGVIEVDAVSHARLFPRCAVVVHHGGAGTTTTAARAGVPQVVVPHVLDQFYWGRRVHQLGLGPPPLPRRRLDAARLAGLLAALLDNEQVAERARHLAGALRGWLAEAPDPASCLTLP